MIIQGFCVGVLRYEGDDLSTPRNRDSKKDKTAGCQRSNSFPVTLRMSCNCLFIVVTNESLQYYMNMSRDGCER